MGGWASVYNSTQASLRFQAQELARLQEMASSGSRVNRPSDAPSDAMRILQYRSTANTLDNYGKNLQSVTDVRDTASNVFTTLNDSMTQARTLIAQGSSGTYSPAQRSLDAQVVDSLLEQAIAFANTNDRGQYLFGGGSTEAPYVARRENGRIVGVDYVGGDQNLSVPVVNGVEYNTVFVGDEVFKSTGRKQPEFLGQTGAKSGTGTSNLRGDAWLTATHESTAYQGASGVAAGASSAAGDTILGTRHTLTIDEPGRTLRLDQGDAVTFTGTEADLKLVNESGDIAYVDARNIQAGFQGAVQASVTGRLSLDDGATSVAADSGANVAITDSRTGDVLYADTTALDRVGVEPVRPHGTYDIFNALISVRDALSNSRNLPENQVPALCDQAMGALAEATAGITQAMTSNGAQLQVMTALQDSTETMASNSRSQADSLENADIV
ncbi:MAG: flagellar hook-associated protein FlgL, partial [Planctomycetota bacterium]|nr:flagellar hook-associated protein FlgL [Planctomycetota bacterium]